MAVACESTKLYEQWILRALCGARAARGYNRRVKAAERTQWMVACARELGFDLCGVAPASDFEELARLPEWLARGYAGEMRYLHDARRQSPSAALPGARSIIVCALNYNTANPYSTEARNMFRDPWPVQKESPSAAPFSPAHTSLKQTATSRAFSTASAVEAPGHESPATNHRPRGWISRYAWGDDYHEVLGEKLAMLVAAMRAEFADEFEARAYVDTGPVVERIAAKYAGLGWLGKNTCFINEHLGSWLFLGVILTTLDLTPSLSGDAEEPLSRRTGSQMSEVGRQKPDLGSRTSDIRLPTSDFDRSRSTYDACEPSPQSLAPSPDLCGNCTQCIDACPTGAIVEPYLLDARRCISYLTIELRGPIPEEFRAAMGWHVFGCDICQDVCPFNRRAPVTDAPEFQPRRIEPENRKEKVEHGASEASFLSETSHRPLATGHFPDSLLAPELEWLASLTEDDFRRIFSGSAVKRAKWRGLVRNARIVISNVSRSGNVGLS